MFEQAERLEEIGAGIQLSPNASRILIGLGLGEQLQRHVVAPEELRVMNADGARVHARAPLGAVAEQRYGAPYWVIHRGDLQAVLIEAVRAHPDIAVHLGARVEDFALEGNGVTISALAAQASVRGARRRADRRRRIVVGPAQPTRSSATRRVSPATPPGARSRQPTRWRPICVRRRSISGSGGDAHLVHYPVRGGSLVNVVAIVRDDWREPGWSAPGDRAEILARYPAGAWPQAARALLATPTHWHKWALYDRAPLAPLGHGGGDLAGGCRPPDAALSRPGRRHGDRGRGGARPTRWPSAPDDPAAAMRRYERQRRGRTARAQRAARRNGTVYHLGGAGGAPARARARRPGRPAAARPLRLALWLDAGLRR